jgi:hypothetical protein
MTDFSWDRRRFIASLAALAAPPEPGFVSIFNGRNLDGWILKGGRGPGYVVEDGVIVCPADGGGNLFTEKQYANFVLRLEWRLWDGGNNGIGIRAPLTGDVAYSGMEIQVLDDEAEVYQKMPIKPTQYTGSVYDVFPAKPGHVKRNGIWNEFEITAGRRRVKVVLNGVTITDADLDTVKDPAVLKKHPGLQNKSGHIGLLGHGTRVEFRNLRVKELD